MGQITDLAVRAAENAVAHGWWDEERETGTLIALMHSELADVIIRILDLAGYRGYRIEEAVLAKMAFNESRPYKHGGKKF